MSSKMKPEIKALWIEALRSGEYEQGRGQLNMNNHFCCLGVLCDLAEKAGVVEGVRNESPCGPHCGLCAHDTVRVSYDGLTGVLPDSVMEWSGMPSYDGEHYSEAGDRHTLMYLNDELNYDFSEIADVIEKEF